MKYFTVLGIMLNFLDKEKRGKMSNSIKKYSEMTKEERKAEREKRNSNIKRMVEANDLKKITEKAIKKLDYYKKRDKVFVTLTTNMKMIVEKYKNYEIKPAYYDMFLKLVNQIDEEMRLIGNEKENITLQN
jgi:hypothetical protein